MSEPTDLSQLPSPTGQPNRTLDPPLSDPPEDGPDWRGAGINDYPWERNPDRRTYWQPDLFHSIGIAFIIVTVWKYDQFTPKTLLYCMLAISACGAIPQMFFLIPSWSRLYLTFCMAGFPILAMTAMIFRFANLSPLFDFFF